MSCINIYHPDYIKLLSEIDDSIIPFELPTLIRLYQKMNNTDKIPSVSEIYEIDNRTKSQERLNQIQDIFNEYPDFSSQIYEALGFKKEINSRLTISQEGSDGFGYVLGLFDNKSERIGKIVYRNKTYLKDKGFPNVNELHLGFEENYQGKGYFQDALVELLNYDDSPIFISNGRVINDNVFKAINKLDTSKLNINKIEDGYIITLNDEITPQQKQQATFMFSEFLDVYLQDFEQVEKILKEENIIEKDCSGGGKLKAEKGLQTNFTKNGKWKMIKDLKGYPTHKEGGVDLTISRNGVSIKNGNTEFTAKHGLLIPKN